MQLGLYLQKDPIDAWVVSDKILQIHDDIMLIVIRTTLIE